MACRANFFSSYHFLRFEGNFPKDPRRVEDLREVDGAGGKDARKRCFRTTSLLASFGGAHGAARGRRENGFWIKRQSFKSLRGRDTCIRVNSVAWVSDKWKWGTWMVCLSVCRIEMERLDCCGVLRGQMETEACCGICDKLEGESAGRLELGKSHGP